MSSPEPDAEAQEEDDADGGEDSVGDAADTGQDLDTEQVESTAVEQPVIHRVALENGDMYFMTVVVKLFREITKQLQCDK